jgi:hypothetical protein
MMAHPAMMEYMNQMMDGDVPMISEECKKMMEQGG